MQRLFRLTQRQQEIADLRADGRSVEEIAEMLHVHRETIKGHLANIEERDKSRAGLLGSLVGKRVYEPPEVETWKPWK
jgi:FixJ family two-component response regulator